MTCQHCTQWNPTSTKRCRFCDNPLDSVEDQTKSGQVRVHQNVTLPKAVRSDYDRPPSTGWLDGGAPVSFKMPAWMVPAGAAAIGVIVIIAMFVRRCG